MALRFRQEPDRLVAEVSGEIDHHSAAELKERIAREYSRGTAKDLELNFSQVTFMDSSGVGMVIGRFKDTQTRGGNMAVSGLSGDIKRLFELSGLHKIIQVK
ncbi:MAG: anti-sigma factor antagonist [Defluviitaleaceae bacterium]|nr:anti-sigma factor antagonist [Defluviitaleaceae bacterium]